MIRRAHFMKIEMEIKKEVSSLNSYDDKNDLEDQNTAFGERSP